MGYWGNDDFFLCLPDDRVQQQDIVITLQTCVNPIIRMSPSFWRWACAR